jgi:6-phosphogluconolactonase (cycloisomerase 2 family)
MEPTHRFNPTRRAVLAGGTALLAASGQSGGALYAYTGCYTTAQRYARGDGIHVYRVNEETGAWSPVQTLGKVVNPSFLAMRPGAPVLYAAHGDETYASAFAIDRRTAEISPLNRVETGGKNGVHLTTDSAGRYLLLANYSSGAVAVVSLRSDGSIGDLVQAVSLPGQPGPHRVEQTSSHPHQVVFDPSGRFVVVSDKGLDRVFVFSFDAETGRLTPTAQGSAVARAGSGPRHAAFHPSLPVLWVLNEISSTVETWYWDAERGHIRAAQILPTLPGDFTGENTASEIAVSAGGRFVYCSNRGHDSIAAYSVDSNTGRLTSVDWTPSQGRVPRFIGFDPARRFLYAANEQSDTIVGWRADAATGRLTPLGHNIANASPSAIAFARL